MVPMRRSSIPSSDVLINFDDRLDVWRNLMRDAIRQVPRSDDVWLVSMSLHKFPVHEVCEASA